MRKRSRLHVHILAFGLIPLLAAGADASCMVDPSPPCQAYWSAQAVFVGTVSEVAYSPKSRTDLGGEVWNTRRRIARFTVETAYKGVDGGQVEVVAREIMETPVTLADGRPGSKHISSSDCNYKFKEGERYLVYAARSPAGDGTYAVGYNRTRPVSEAGEDLEFINGLARAGAASRIYGAVRRADRNVSDGNYRPAAPVVGARVTARGPDGSFEGLTDAEGKYRLEGLPPGAYHVEAALPAHLAHAGEPQVARVVARGCAEINFHTRADGRIGGRVTDADGRPMPEIVVDLIAADGPGISLRGLRAYADKDGRYEFKDVPAGRFLLGVNLSRAPGAGVPHPRTYYPGEGSEARATVVELGEGQKLADYDLRLLPRFVERAVEVVVTWPDGRPVNDAGLRLEDPRYFWDSAATPVERVDEEGRYRLTGYDGVRYWVHAWVSLKDGRQMHAEPAKLSMKEGAGPVRLVITSEYGNCPHYRRDTL